MAKGKGCGGGGGSKKSGGRGKPFGRDGRGSGNKKDTKK